jgi:hypothetical protein
MKAQGTKMVSRGQLKEGVSTDQSMLSFIPFHLTSIQISPAVKDWLCSWVGEQSKLLMPNGWFERGHNVLAKD